MSLNEARTLTFLVVGISLQNGRSESAEIVTILPWSQIR